MASVLAESTSFLLGALQAKRLTTIVDVGANPIITPDYAALLQNGGCKVVGFEPQEQAFAKLEKTKGPNEVYFPHAVGDGTEVELHLFRAEGMTSIFPPHRASINLIAGRRMSRVDRTVKFKTKELDKIRDLPKFDLLKIDIQGGEAKVFDCARKVMSTAVAVMVELRYHQLYEGEPMLSGVDQRLRDMGFALHKFMFNKSMSLRNSQAHRLHRRRVLDQLVDGDGVYVRNLTTIPSWSDDQLIHLAILSDAIFRSPSLTVMLLDHLVARGKVSASLPGAYVDALPSFYRTEPQPEAQAAQG